MRSNITVLGWLHIVWHGLGVITGIIAMIVLTLMGGFMGIAGGHDAHVVTPIFMIVGLFVFTVTVVLSLPGLIIGWGLITLQPWARIGGIILSALNLTVFPLGTALGVFGLITLCDTQASDIFAHPNN